MCDEIFLSNICVRVWRQEAAIDTAAVLLMGFANLYDAVLVKPID
jgi:hypothetical protein